MLELLRVKQRDDKVAEKQDRDDESNGGDEIHCALPQLLAGADVEECQGEEDSGEKDHGQVLHIGLTEYSPFLHRLWAGIEQKTAGTICALTRDSGVLSICF
jgi:hypothetical protein